MDLWVSVGSPLRLFSPLGLVSDEISWDLFILGKGDSKVTLR